MSVNVGGCPRYADFRGILVDACRPESDDVGWVGVKIGVKLAAFQHTGMSPAIMMGYTGSPGVYTR